MEASTIITWPPERFFWAILDAPAWTRAGPVPPGFLDAVAEDLPVPVDDLHAVGVPLGDGRVLIVAALKDELAHVPIETLALAPASPPPELIGVDVSTANLLCGPFEPPTCRAARVRRHGSWAALTVTCAVLVTLGLERRARHWEATANRAKAAWTEAVHGRVPGTDPDVGAFKLSRQAEFTGAAATIPLVPDAALALAELLDVWPTSVAAGPQSISIRNNAATVSVVAADSSAFLREFAPPMGWTLDQPMLSAVGDGQRLTLTLHKAEVGS
jgi:hypothetical protein